MGSSMARYAILTGIDLLDDVVTTGEIARAAIDPCGKNGPKMLVRTLADVVERFVEVDSGFTVVPATLEKILKKAGSPPSDTTSRQIFSVLSRLADDSGLGRLPLPILEQMLSFDAEVAEIVTATEARDKKLKAAGGDEAARASALQTFESVVVNKTHSFNERAEHWGHWASGLCGGSDSISATARFQQLWLQLLRFMAYDEIQWMRAEIVGRDNEAVLIADEDHGDATAAARRALVAAQATLRALSQAAEPCSLPSLRVFLAGNEILLSALAIPRRETIGHERLRAKWDALCIVESTDAASWCGMTSRLLRGLIEYAGYADDQVAALRMWERLKLRDPRFSLKEGIDLQPAYWEPDLEALTKDDFCVNVVKIIAEYENFIDDRKEEETSDQRVDAYVAHRQVPASSP